MNRIERSGIALICLGVVLYALSAEPPSLAESQAPTVTTQVPEPTVQNPIKPPTIPAYIPVQKKMPAYVPSKPPLSKGDVDGRYAQMHGLIGESERWVQDVFDNQYWTSTEPFKFMHTNGAQLSLTRVDGRVVSVRMDFPAGLLSPHIQTVLDYALGRGTVAPFYLDTLESATEELTGSFRHKDKHQLRYTAGRILSDGRAKKHPMWLLIELDE